MLLGCAECSIRAARERGGRREDRAQSGASATVLIDTRDDDPLIDGETAPQHIHACHDNIQPCNRKQRSPVAM